MSKTLFREARLNNKLVMCMSTHLQCAGLLNISLVLDNLLRKEARSYTNYTEQGDKYNKIIELSNEVIDSFLTPDFESTTTRVAFSLVALLNSDEDRTPRYEWGSAEKTVLANLAFLFEQASDALWIPTERDPISQALGNIITIIMCLWVDNDFEIPFKFGNKLLARVLKGVASILLNKDYEDYILLEDINEYYAYLSNIKVDIKPGKLSCQTGCFEGNSVPGLLGLPGRRARAHRLM